jgi:hypothetical protein
MAVNSINGRLRRLEEQGYGGSCPECRLATRERRPIAVIWEEETERGFQGDPHEVCSSCGHPLYTVLRVVRDSPSFAGEATEGEARR